MNQKEYLRKYLSAEEDGIKKKKKKKRPNVGTKTVKIIDDDVDVKNMRPIKDGEFEIFNTTEDAPQIVGIIDERGPVDFADKRRWRIIADDGEGNVACSSNENKEKDSGNTSHVEKSDQRKGDISKISKKLRQKKGTSGEDLDSSRKSRNGNERKIANHTADSDVSPPRKPRDASDSDLSPPRALKPEKRNHKSREPTNSKSKKSSKKRRKDASTESSSSSSESSDSSSQGKSRRRNNVKSRSKSDSDLSPPRNNKRSRSGKNPQADSESDLSPPRRSRNDEKAFRTERNLSRSPTRSSRKSKNYDNDSRNPKDKLRTRKDSDSDLSPPRRSKNDQTVVKSVRNKSRSPVTSSRKPGGSDSDLSPPRARSKKSTDPIRDSRRREDPRNDERKRGPREYDSSRVDVTERRRRRSPRRSRWNDEQSRRSRSSERPGKDDDARMTKTLDGKTAGLQDARNLRIETAAHKKREAEMFKNMSAEVSGVGQMPVLRDRRTGRKRDLNAEAAERREKEKRQEEIDEKYAKWGKGLKQVDDHAEKVQRDLYEMSKPLARYADDADLDKALREVMHVGDPMLDYIKNKQIKEGKREPERPSYQGSYMPNRFGIKPGHRWDGVDRSNGYEKKWFDARNARTALQEEAYKWSTADM